MTGKFDFVSLIIMEYGGTVYIMTNKHPRFYILVSHPTCVTDYGNIKQRDTLIALLQNIIARKLFTSVSIQELKRRLR